MSLIHNERTKLTATALNGAAVTSLAAGVVTPVAAWSFGVAASSAGSFAALVSFVWLCVAVGLHVMGRVVLGGLKP